MPTGPETDTIPSGDDYPVVVDLYAPRGVSPPWPRAVVLCHGFTGHRRWGFIPWLGEHLAGAGLPAVAMDFSLNGHVAPGGATSGRPISPDAFRRNTLGRESDDLAAVLRWLDGPEGRLASGAPVGLWGHSRGVVAVLMNARERGVRAIVTWSTGATPHRYSDRQVAAWRRDGALAFQDAASGTELAMGVAYLDDIEQRAGEYSPLERAAAIDVPWLFIHGDHDPVVPVAEAVSVYASSRAPEKELLRIATGHNFGYEPGRESGAALVEAADATAAWFASHLKEDHRP